MKTLSEIVLPTDLPNWYIKKYSNLLQPVRVMAFLYATTVLLITMIFYVKNKKTVYLKLQHREGINVTWFVRYYLSSRPEVFCKKSVLGNFSKLTEKYLCWSSFLIKLQVWGLQLYQKETSAQVFSSEFCEIFNNTYFVYYYLSVYVM